MKSSAPPLTATHPELAAQWHRENSKAPEDVTAGSGYRAKWVCPKDAYEWEAIVSNRACRGSGCPVCANRVIVAGVNDLASKFPDIAAQWHPDNTKKATEVSPGAGYRAKWQCAEGHVWTIPVANRTGENFSTGCPVCAGKAVAEGVNDLASARPDLVSEWSPQNGISPSKVSAGSHRKFEWVCAAGHTWKASVESRVSAGTGCGKCSGRHVDAGVNDLRSLHPDIAAQWSPNNPRPSESYRPGSNHVAEWVCAHGHVWKTSIANRTKQGTGCPTCGNKEVLAGFNDLATTHPVLAAQWSPSNDRSTSEVTAGSVYRAEWGCSHGHTWKAVVASRSRGMGCPYCSGRLPIVGVTDVATTHPHLLKEWDASNAVTLESVSRCSEARMAWQCEKGHTWDATIVHRCRGTGCPECARNSFSSKGEKELAAFVGSLLPGVEVRTTYRGIKGVGELDVYVPSLGLAFEYNGVYYHSEAVKSNKYAHYSKFRACEDAGVRLVVVWEDDWRDRRPVVEKMVAAKLGVRRVPTFGAREMSLDIHMPSVESALFLDREHLQGSVHAARHIGLRDVNGDTTAVMALVFRRGNMEIARFASRGHVAGGFPRLLSAACDLADSAMCSRVVTYSDNSTSNGNLYMRNGFHAEREVPPSWQAVWRSTRYHRSSFKISRFRNDPSLVYREGVTYDDLLLDNGIHKLWDYGKVRWEKDI